MNAHEEELAVGRRAVLEALRSPGSIDKVWMERGLSKGAVGPIMEAARAQGIPVEWVPPERMKTLTTERTQGVVARLAGISYLEAGDVLRGALEASSAPVVVFLDHIQDPHNLGAIARSAEALGASGLVVPKRRAAAVTAGAMRASAGALVHLRVGRTANLNRAAEEAKVLGYWLYALDAAGERDLFELAPDVPIVLIVGAEGKGVSRLLAERADERVRIPLHGKINALNASVACGIALAVLSHKRDGAQA